MSTTTTFDGPPASKSTDATEGMNAMLRKNWWLIALRGLLGVLFGLIALFFPGPTMLSLVLLFSAYMLVDGVFSIVASVRGARRQQRWGLLLLQGILSIITGAVAFLWPAITVLAFVLLIAAWAIVSGSLMLGATFRLQGDHGRWWLGFGGFASIVYGVLLIIAPLIGAVVLTWWLGAYALVFGVALIVLAFKLRSRRDDRPSTTAATAPT